MFQAIVRLSLLQGSPADIKVNSSTVITLITCLAVLAWFGGGGIAIPASSTVPPEDFNAIKRIATIIPLLQHAITAAMIFTVLSVRRLTGRFMRTLTAYLGIQIVFQVGLVFLSSVAPLFPSTFAIVFDGVQLGLQIWLLAVLGYILRHAFDIKMYQGVLAAIAIVLLSYFLAGIATGILFPEDMRALVEYLDLETQIRSSSDPI